MSTIRIPRPPSPLPPLPSPARKWKRREEWAAEPDKRDLGPTSGEPDAFVQKIRGLLFGGRQ